MFEQPLSGLLSNGWFAFVVENYNIFILLIGSLLITILKSIAIMHPDVKTNKILCLLKGWIYGFPGMKKEEAAPEVEN
ncbi:MAG: hypothetical protein PHG91_14230 [Syntrophales bacterium]|jgi:hypothetical protein|nr:hypothetical protein [Syntrophales bacterium]